MKKTYLAIVIVSILAVLIYAAPADDASEAEAASQIAAGVQHVVNVADEVTASIKDAQKEQQAESGYPEGYDPSNPIANGEFTEEDWERIQMEDAMRSIAEDAMREEAIQEDIHNSDGPLF